MIGSHHIPITCDTGAEVTVVPAECVLPHQLTGDTCELKSFNQAKSEGKWCTVNITIDSVVFKRKAVTQSGESLGWSACLSLDMADEKEGNFLLDQMRRRAALSEKETLYLPPEVRDGALLSGVLAREAMVVRRRDKGRSLEKVEKPEDNTQADVPVQSTTVEAPQEKLKQEENEDIVGDGEKVCEVILVDAEKNLVSEEEEGEPLGGSATEKGTSDLTIKGIRTDIPRTKQAAATKDDKSLEAVYNLGLQDREGYHVEEGLLFRTRIDGMGDTVEQLCIPAGYCDKCLERAHNSFGHQGRNKLSMLLRPSFYWPNMSRDCVRYV